MVNRISDRTHEIDLKGAAIINISKAEAFEVWTSNARFCCDSAPRFAVSRSIQMPNRQRKTPRHCQSKMSSAASAAGSTDCETCNV